MFLKTILTGVAIAVVAGGSAIAAECTLPADAQAGKAVSNQCKACHVFEADKPSRPTAPNIHDIYDSKAGERKDFPRYSQGMQGAAAKGLVWNDQNLMEYLNDPKAFLNKVNGAEVKHAMFFALKDEKKRQDVVAFLKAIKGKPECN